MQHNINQSTPIVRVSDYFKLPYKQGELPFVDVDIHGDTKLFVDPRALRLLNTDWSAACVTSLQNFFHSVLLAIREGRDNDAKRMLGGLREPNETHLGMSQDKAEGRGMGPSLANDVWSALTASDAAATGLLEDLEDTALMVEGIDKDIVSDISTNIIRRHLIAFTQEICRDYGIPLTSGVDSGPLWGPSGAIWTSHHVDLPRTNFGKILLVPKEIVRQHLEFSRKEYFQDYILTHLQNVELGARSELVQLLKNGTEKVTKKSIKNKYGTHKTDIVRITANYPEILQKYRSDKGQRPLPPLDYKELNDGVGISQPDWNNLLAAVRSVPPGKAHANDYVNVVERLLTPLFYPELTSPQKEFPIHDGLKRIDIRYANLMINGFFRWVGQHHPAMNVFVECKNYVGDPANPELDQLAGRFCPSRGKLGFLVCRSFKNKPRFITRCINTSKDERGFIIALDDVDLNTLVSFRKADDSDGFFNFLKARFDELIM